MFRVFRLHIDESLWQMLSDDGLLIRFSPSLNHLFPLLESKYGIRQQSQSAATLTARFTYSPANPVRDANRTWECGLTLSVNGHGMAQQASFGVAL